MQWNSPSPTFCLGPYLVPQQLGRIARKALNLAGNFAFDGPRRHTPRQRRSGNLQGRANLVKAKTGCVGGLLAGVLEEQP